MLLASCVDIGHSSILVSLEIHDKISVLLATEHAWSDVVSRKLEIGLRLPLRCKGAVAVHERVGEYRVAIDVFNRVIAVFRLERDEIRVVHDMVGAVGLVSQIHSLHSVGDIDGVCPGVLLLDVGDFDAWRGESGRDEQGGRGRAHLFS